MSQKERNNISIDTQVRYYREQHACKRFAYTKTLKLLGVKSRPYNQLYHTKCILVKKINQYFQRHTNSSNIS